MNYIRSNFVYSAISQFVTYILPFIVLPYVTRVFEPDVFGEISYALSVATYFVLITDYGFSWNTTYRISRDRDDTSIVNKIFVSAWTLQILISVILLPVYFIYVYYQGVTLTNNLMLVFAYTCVVSNVFFPFWYFQGANKISVALHYQIIYKIIGVVAIFIIVQNKTDWMWYILFTNFANFAAGLTVLHKMNVTDIYLRNPPSLRTVFNEAKLCFSSFVTRLSVSFYTSLVPVMLGTQISSHDFALFMLADKIRQAAQSLITPITQVVSPFIAFQNAKSNKINLDDIKKYGAATILVGAISSAGLYFFSNFLINLLGGNKFTAASGYLQGLSILPFVISISNVLGIQVLLPLNRGKQFNKILTLTGYISPLLTVPLVLTYKLWGAIISMVLVEFVVAILLGICVYISIVREVKNENFNSSS